MNSRCSQQRPISEPKLRPRNLAAQEIELVPQHQQLDVLHVQAAAAPQKRPEQNDVGRNDDAAYATSRACSAAAGRENECVMQRCSAPSATSRAAPGRLT